MADFVNEGDERHSLDPNLRPSSVRADAPWIGTFNFEGQKHDQHHAAADNLPLASHSPDSTSSAEQDLEKQKTADTPVDKEVDQRDPNIVDFDGPDDPYNPTNWPNSSKWLYALIAGLITFVVTFASSVFSTATEVTSVEFGVSTEVMTLGTALFVLGFAFGPLLFGPLSELYGRKIPLFTGYFIFGIFQIPVAVAQNLQTIFICRFLGGFFASAPIVTTAVLTGALVLGGFLADFFDPVHRGLAVCVFSGATFIGPVTGPIIGGFVTQSYLGWRWTAWLTCIMAFSFGGLACIIIPESFAPVLLKRKAVRLRLETKNWALHAKSEESPVDFNTIVNKYLKRPILMTLMEPILVLMTVYMSLIYGILYLFFEAFPVTFEEERGFNLGVGALPFVSIGVGVCCGASIITYTTLTRFKTKFEQNGHVVPEERLIPMIIGGALLPIGLFWFAWTSDPSITPWPQIISGVPVGAGIQMIFLQGLNYIIDVYLMHANSALTANTFLRSWVGAGFIMFATGMYHNLGVNWATSLLGFLSAALFPVPILFFIYGERIRRLSRYSPT